MCIDSKFNCYCYIRTVVLNRGGGNPPPGKNLVNGIFVDENNPEPLYSPTLILTKLAYFHADRPR